MKLHRLASIGGNQGGFTIVELLIAVAITGLIVGPITMIISQLFTNNAQSIAHITTVKQVENAIHWISRDAQMAQVVEPSGSSGFPLKLTWVEWNNTVNQVTYSVQNGNLRRSHSIDGDGPTETLVAEHIDSSSEMTNVQVVDSVLTLKITATVTGFRTWSETRVVEIGPRPMV